MWIEHLNVLELNLNRREEKRGLINVVDRKRGYWTTFHEIVQVLLKIPLFDNRS